eukprot:GDKI01019636.1.p1 GENE.GDKI01019636.1~~GDKI01019636.1.p1  ORF type:complete len:367 (-),score=109.74 GDKI01019636.1:520-1467(-)
MDRGVTHNDLLYHNVGVFATGGPALYDWGLADVCRKSFPPFLRPLVFAQQLASLLFGATMMHNKHLLDDLQAEYQRLFTGQHPRYVTEALVSTVYLSETEMPGMTAALQKNHADKSLFALDKPAERAINALIVELARNGRIPYQPTAAEITIEFPYKVSSDCAAVPTVKHWHFEGGVHTWAEDGGAAERKLGEVEGSECMRARHWLDECTALVWMIQCRMNEATFNVEVLESLTPNDSTIRKYTYTRGKDRSFFESIDDNSIPVVPPFDTHTFRTAPSELMPEWHEWLAQYAPLSLYMPVAGGGGETETVETVII